MNESLNELYCVCGHALFAGPGYCHVLCSNYSLCRPAWIYVFSEGVFVIGPLGFQHRERLFVLSPWCTRHDSILVLAAVIVRCIGALYMHMYLYIFSPVCIFFPPRVGKCSDVRGSVHKYLLSTLDYQLLFLLGSLTIASCPQSK